MFAERRFRDGGLGNALIRDGNGTRSFETLLRYRGAAMAEFWRALKTLKALQAEQAAANEPALAAHSFEAHLKPAAARPPLVHRPRSDEPERAAAPRLDYVMPDPSTPGGTLHEPAAPWLPNEPETRPGPRSSTPNQPPIATATAPTESVHPAPA